MGSDPQGLTPLVLHVIIGNIYESPERHVSNLC
jgi:hypothetical protein